MSRDNLILMVTIIVAFLGALSLAFAVEHLLREDFWRRAEATCGKLRVEDGWKLEGRWLIMCGDEMVYPLKER